VDEVEEEGGCCRLGYWFWISGLDSDFGFCTIWDGYTLHSGGSLYYTTLHAIRLFMLHDLMLWLNL
jgi:hypothetical protein